MARIRNQKKPNKKRAIVLAVLLVVIVFLWFNVDGLIERLFE